MRPNHATVPDRLHDTADIVLQIVVAMRSEIALLDVVRLLDQR